MTDNDKAIELRVQTLVCDLRAELARDNLNRVAAALYREGGDGLIDDVIQSFEDADVTGDEG